ncbi:hypothetical protein ASC97_29170 [Rhizobium sp. Root1203]|nr:hypothetical protein ASC97_29170 [Rhizobium sp. Root1203]
MPTLGAAASAALAKFHPKLQIIADEAIKEIDFRVLATRGWADRSELSLEGRARLGSASRRSSNAISCLTVG